MSIQANQIFVNLPVSDLEKSMKFFGEMGFDFDERMTDNNATCMIIGPNIYAMLLVEDFFKSFTHKAIADTSKSAEAIIALAASSREEVDEWIHKAIAAGGDSANEPMDNKFMYSWSFHDPDGHLWEVMYMEDEAFE
ncbi:VOC family protein [Planococcus dechangensis]|uniref:VOC family protein n=1 Tax=Planococcus dechangensis TaxID=1176255 RepID=A0ABV9M9J1_9BACL